jgi:predicted phosphodiesterase
MFDWIKSLFRKQYKGIVFIGDIHGDTAMYEEALKQVPEDYISIQLGDLGVGFTREIDAEIERLHKEYPTAYWIRGNHDNPSYSCPYNRCLESGYYPDLKMFVFSGAESPDRHLRVEGLNWWKEEEHTQSYMGYLISLAKWEDIKLFVSHDGPLGITKFMFPQYMWGQEGSRTANALQKIWNVTCPDNWVFGHHHATSYREEFGCNFYCVDQYKMMPLGTLPFYEIKRGE